MKIQNWTTELRKKVFIRVNVISGCENGTDKKNLKRGLTE